MAKLPPDDETHLADKGLEGVVVEERSQRGLIISRYPLPAGKYDHERADLLILLPGGYPDSAPDMFHTDPWIRLMPQKALARRADAAVDFAGRRWQRWSRHNSEWRPGRDGIWTMLARVDEALLIAAV